MSVLESKLGLSISRKHPLLHPSKTARPTVAARPAVEVLHGRRHRCRLRQGKILELLAQAAWSWRRLAGQDCPDGHLLKWEFLRGKMGTIND